MNLPAAYCGRFAPSPTGPLHLGSMVAAVASYLQARSQGGRWLVRVEDLDPPREVAGAADDIVRTLALYGFEWHGEVLYQSQRGEAYLAALEQLQTAGWIYPCSCSRKEVAAAGRVGSAGPIYPGTCRDRQLQREAASAWRLRTEDQIIAFNDAVAGEFRCNLQHEVGDFVLRRADGLFAYQLAVVVDDAAQGVTEVVRGRDLLYSTPRQIYLQHCLGVATPAYIHLPVVKSAEGQKLSKQSGAAAVREQRPQVVLSEALHFLGQAPPPELLEATLAELWQWATTHWLIDDTP